MSFFPEEQIKTLKKDDLVDEVACLGLTSKNKIKKPSLVAEIVSSIKNHGLGHVLDLGLVDLDRIAKLWVEVLVFVCVATGTSIVSLPAVNDLDLIDFNHDHSRNLWHLNKTRHLLSKSCQYCPLVSSY